MVKWIIFFTISMGFAGNSFADCNAIRDYIPLDYCKEPAGDLLCPKSGVHCKANFVNDEGDNEEINFSCNGGDILDSEEANELQLCTGPSVSFCGTPHVQRPVHH